MLRMVSGESAYLSCHFTFLTYLLNLRALRSIQSPVDLINACSRLFPIVCILALNVLRKLLRLTFKCLVMALIKID